MLVVCNKTEQCNSQTKDVCIHKIPHEKIKTSLSICDTICPHCGGFCEKINPFRKEKLNKIKNISNI